VEGFDLLVLIPIVLVAIAEISLFYTATCDPGVLLRSQDPGLEHEKERSIQTDPGLYGTSGGTSVTMDGYNVRLKFCRKDRCPVLPVNTTQHTPCFNPRRECCRNLQDFPNT
jgi:hypothetical protein